MLGGRARAGEPPCWRQGRPPPRRLPPPTRRTCLRGPHPLHALQNGVHYHFTTHDKMEAEIAAGKFLEYAHVHKNIYGTSIQVGAGGCSCARDPQRLLQQLCCRWRA